jgi:DNA-binding PadR family transcriptional regulator
MTHPDIYDDLQALESAGLVRRCWSEEHGCESWTLTDAGHALAARLHGCDYITYADLDFVDAEIAAEEHGA